MNTNMLASASALSDTDLLARVAALAVREREASVELIAHLAVLDTRPALYAAQGYGSLFAYCTQALRLSEDATCNRIVAARTCKRFPGTLDLLASGALSVASLRILSPCLTTENHGLVLSRAVGRSRREIEALVAELAPRPDVPSSVRKLPAVVGSPVLPSVPAVTFFPRQMEGAITAPAEPARSISNPSPLAPLRRPVIETTSPERYRVQFTIGQEGHDKLRRLQTLLRREIPNGDPGAIVERALSLLLEKVEKAKFGGVAKERPTRTIRPGTDTLPSPGTSGSRNLPSDVTRAAWSRDGGQCAFVSPDGLRCTERTFLEFHHVRPYAHGGPATVDNISLRCRRHNQYESELVFGRYGAAPARDSLAAPPRPQRPDRP